MLNKILSDIEKALENECWLSALALTLTIPDICGKAEYPCDKVTDRYKKWCAEYFSKYETDGEEPTMPYMNEELLYSLRNSFLHQGTPNVDIAKVKAECCKVDKFVLSIDDSPFIGGSSLIDYDKNNNISYREIEVNVIMLCKKLVAVAKGYYRDNAEKFNFFDYTLTDRRQ